MYGTCIFEKMTSFSPILNQDLEQGKLMAVVNSLKWRSKNVTAIMLVTDENLARYLHVRVGMTYCVRKCKKKKMQKIVAL